MPKFRAVTARDRVTSAALWGERKVTFRVGMTVHPMLIHAWKK